MNTFTKDFKKAVMGRGLEYFNKVSPYDRELKDNEFFRHFGKEEGFEITSVQFGTGSGIDFEEFEKNMGDITIHFRVLKHYRGCGSDWEELWIEFPAWILSEREEFQNRLAERYRWLWNQDEKKRRENEERDRNQMQTLARRLGYRLEKIGGDK